MQDWDETKLVEKLHLHDRRALEYLYDHYSPIIYGIALLITYDEKKAEIVLSKTITQIWNRENNVSIPTNLLWKIVSIARQNSFEMVTTAERSRFSERTNLKWRVENGDDQAVLEAVFFSGIPLDKAGQMSAFGELKIRNLLHSALVRYKKESVTR